MLLLASWLLLAPRRAAGECNSATVTALSGAIVGSDYMSSPLEAGDECTFRVQPASASPVQTVLLVFQTLNVNTAELMVYEGADARTDRLRWSCLRCEDVLPPPFYMDLGAALVTFRAPAGQPAGFSFTYVAHTDDLTGTVVVDMLMSSALIFGPATSSGAAPRDLTYEWRIDPENCGGDCDVIIVIEAMVLQAGDYVRISEGNTIVAQWDGATAAPRAWTFASRDRVYLRVKTTDDPADDAVDFAFTARYVANGPTCHRGTYCNCGAAGKPSDVVALTGRTAPFSDGSARGSAMELDACQWLVAPTLLAPYAADPALTWPAGGGWRPKLTMVADRVSIKETGILRVYDGGDDSGELLWDCDGCGHVAPPPIEASGAKLYVEYVSDAYSAYIAGTSLEWTGWHAQYSAPTTRRCGPRRRASSGSTRRRRRRRRRRRSRPAPATTASCLFESRGCLLVRSHCA